MTQLHITWNEGKGNMTINCENFFPVTQNKMKVLLKTIDLDWEHKDDILKQMLNFLQELEHSCLQKQADIKETFGHEHQKMCDLQHLVDDGRKPNGLPVSKVELKTARAELKEQKKVVREMQEEFKVLQKKVQKVKVNQEFVKGKM